MKLDYIDTTVLFVNASLKKRGTVPTIEDCFTELDSKDLLDDRSANHLKAAFRESKGLSTRVHNYWNMQASYDSSHLNRSQKNPLIIEAREYELNLKAQDEFCRRDKSADYLRKNYDVRTACAYMALTDRYASLPERARIDSAICLEQQNHERVLISALDRLRPAA